MLFLYKNGVIFLLINTVLSGTHPLTLRTLTEPLLCVWPCLGPQALARTSLPGRPRVSIPDSGRGWCLWRRRPPACGAGGQWPHQAAFEAEVGGKEVVLESPWMYWTREQGTESRPEESEVAEVVSSAARQH